MKHVSTLAAVAATRIRTFGQAVVAVGRKHTGKALAVAIAGGASIKGSVANATPPEAESLIDWTTVTADLQASLSEPATKAVIIGGLVLAAVLGWALIKRFAR